MLMIAVLKILGVMEKLRILKTGGKTLDKRRSGLLSVLKRISTGPDQELVRFYNNAFSLPAHSEVPENLQATDTLVSCRVSSRYSGTTA